MTKAEGKQKQSLRAAKDRKKRVQSVMWIGGDEELTKELREAEGRRQRQENIVEVRGDNTSDADRLLLQDLHNQVDTLKESIKNSAIKFVFQAIGRKRYDKLMEDYPPTKEQMVAAEKDGESITFNPDTFPFALIDACAIEPEHEPGELEEWLRDDPDEEWNTAEITDLFHSAVGVNVNRNRVDLGKG